MIYVTVGTHEQPFNRLIRCIDELKGNGIIEEEVMIQSGYSDYEIKHCSHKDILNGSDNLANYRNARMIIMHGGPSSIIQALQEGKIPIVVPRQKKYDEHINDHQLVFCRAVSKRYNNIILIEDITELENAIVNYDKLAGERKASVFNNNEAFCEGLARIVEEM